MQKFVWSIGMAALFAATSAFADPVADFRASDKNGDRQLQPDEFRNFVDLRAQAADKMAQRVRALRSYGVAFARVDSDKNGSVSGDELRAVANRN